MKILIIEDDELWILKLQMMVEQIDKSNKIYICKDFNEIEFFLLEYNPEVVITDIQLDDNHSIFEIVDKIKNIPTIFITAYPIEQYQEMATDLPKSYFIVKPFHYLTIKAMFDDIIKQKNIPFSEESKTDNPPKFLRIIDKFRQKSYIAFDDILYIEGDGNYIKIFTESKKVSIKRSLQKIKDELDNDFIQIQKAFIVNKNYITRIDYSRGIVYVNLTPLPLGRVFRKELLEANLNFVKKI